MKVKVKEAKLQKGIIYIYANESKFSGKEVYLSIDTKKRENFEYIKEKLHKYPWTNSCRTWGEIIKNIPEKTIELSIRYLDT